MPGYKSYHSSSIVSGMHLYPTQPSVGVVELNAGLLNMEDGTMQKQQKK